ncbi:protein phosphatase 1 regulatory subunit 3B isoform X2 [Cryptotermes secundus]|uniref:protein phosphatase 1 regulatory subunit 3B isoform X2 n=1 Tax=Cryptotermes secundus TaxID=105785 RepID=UPI000CD7D8CB|nr:protein phosphatase 1 regulatory subunit 3B isoform X2 [Cryptotermes secundus]
MPADYEMLVARSPPVSADFLSNYSSCRLKYEAPACSCIRPRQFSPQLPAQRTSPVHLPIHSHTDTQLKSVKMPVAVPRRPCLVVRPEDTSGSSDENDLPSPTRLKKKVVFADDKGLSLTQVRVMTEPSNVPPMFSFQFLAQVTKGISAEVVPEPWEVTFQQPASDYLDFRKRLDTGNVSLENVIVRESEDIVVGTVKVRNIAYHKEVFVRTSSDDWMTHEDAYCTFVNSNTTTPETAAFVLYDTFSFRLTLPPRSHRLEFCVCFRCQGAEYWDSNSGKNYVLLKKSSSKEEEFLLHKLRRSNSDNSPIQNKIRMQFEDCGSSLFCARRFCT